MTNEDQKEEKNIKKEHTVKREYRPRNTKTKKNDEDILETSKRNEKRPRVERTRK